MRDCLIVVDFQNDFITGVLGNDYARAVVPNILNKIRAYIDSGRPIIFTRDTHMEETYFNTHEGKWLPIAHCIRRTEGYELQPDAAKLVEFYDHAYVTDKATFGYTGWSSSIYGFNSIEIVGVMTDICVVTNALFIRAMFPELDIFVDANCCAGTTKENHEAALRVMNSCHIEVRNGENGI